MDTLGAEVDQLVEIQRTIAINQALGTDTYTAEVLPGEVVCEDGVVRRATTAEAQGESFYTYEEPKDTQRVSVEQGRAEAMKGGLVYFRPDRRVGTGEFALVNTKEEL
jgi:hypothetical protein